jgi:threonine synthase
VSEFRFRSSRDPALVAGFSAALLQGLAPDGGLYLPCAWPRLTPAEFAGAEQLAEVAVPLLAPFLAGDPLGTALAAVASEAFNFPAPLVPLTDDGRLAVLELFHGPTAAFKDFGARFLAACFAGGGPPGGPPPPPRRRSLTRCAGWSRGARCGPDRPARPGHPRSGRPRPR